MYVVNPQCIVETQRYIIKFKCLGIYGFGEYDFIVRCLVLTSNIRDQLLEFYFSFLK